MKNLIANRKFAGVSAIVLALAVGITAPATQALGQTSRAAVNIPFDFQNGSEHLPAGHYTVGMDSQHIMRLESGKITSMTLSRTEINLKPAASGKLVFRKYGNRYFLREVWQAESTEHQILPKSKAEKRQQIGQSSAERNGTEVALLEPLK